MDVDRAAEDQILLREHRGEGIVQPIQRAVVAGVGVFAVNGDARFVHGDGREHAAVCREFTQHLVAHLAVGEIGRCFIIEHDLALTAPAVEHVEVLTALPALLVLVFAVIVRVFRRGAQRVAVVQLGSGFLDGGEGLLHLAVGGDGL